MKNCILFGTLILLFACSSNKDGYTDLNEDVSVKLLAFGDESNQLSSASYYLLEMTFDDQNGNSYQRQEIFRNLKPDALGDEDWFNDFIERREGDAVQYLLSCKTLEGSIFQPEMDWNCEGTEHRVKMQLSILETWTTEEYKSWLSDQSFTNPTDEFQFLKSQVALVPQSDSLQQIGELFYHWIERGNGSEIDKDSLLRLHYRGFLLDQTNFDFSAPDSGLVFRSGEQGQVLRGIEIAVNNCRYGDSLIIYMPSYLGFGSRGSTNGTVPPYSAIAYALKIESLN